MENHDKDVVCLLDWETSIAQISLRSVFVYLCACVCVCARARACMYASGNMYQADRYLALFDSIIWP